MAFMETLYIHTIVQVLVIHHQISSDATQNCQSLKFKIVSFKKNNGLKKGKEHYQNIFGVQTSFLNPIVSWESTFEQVDLLQN